MEARGVLFFARVLFDLLASRPRPRATATVDPLAAGYWLLVTGCWLLAAGYRGLEAGMRTIGCRLLAVDWWLAI